MVPVIEKQDSRTPWLAILASSANPSEIPCLKIMVEGWRYFSVVNSTDYSSRGLRLSSQHPHEDQMLSSGLCGQRLHVVLSHTCKQNTHRHKISKSLKKNNPTTNKVGESGYISIAASRSRFHMNIEKCMFCYLSKCSKYIEWY